MHVRNPLFSPQKQCIHCHYEIMVEEVQSGADPKVAAKSDMVEGKATRDFKKGETIICDVNEIFGRPHSEAQFGDTSRPLGRME